MFKDLKVFNLDVLTEVIKLENSGEDGLLQDLVTSYKDNNLPLVDKLIDCEAKNDLMSFERAAHSLKSSSQLLGLERVESIAAAIEAEALDKRMSLELIPELRKQLELALTELEFFLHSRRK